MDLRFSKISILILLLVASFNSLQAQTDFTNQRNLQKELSWFQKVKMGELEIFILSDGFLRHKGLEGYSPNAQVKDLKKTLYDNFRPTDYIDMSMNIPLVKTKDRLILIDAGMGVFSDENSGKLLGSLHRAGFKAEEITDIFILHAHIDHIGGLIDKNNIIVFPSAQYHIAEREFEFWTNATINDFENSYLYKNFEAIQFDIDAAKRVFSVIRPKIRYFDYGKNLYGHFTFQLVPGHTPGMTFITISSAGKVLTYTADLAHSDVLLFPFPEWGYYADVDLKLAINSRKRMSEQLSQSRSATLGYHLPYPGLGNIQKDGEKYLWKPMQVFAPIEIKF